MTFDENGRAGPSQHSAGLYSVLRFPAVYSRIQSALVRNGGMTGFVDQYVVPRVGDRILDIGCGPASIRPLLGNVDYVGVDTEPRYISLAQSRFPGRGRFLCKPVEAVGDEISGPFDVVLAIAILHHLDDPSARAMFRLARRMLEAGGRLVAIDPVITRPQNPLARALIRLDRGRCVRTADSYVTLARESFGRVDSEVRTDFLRVPYSHHVMVCHA